MHDEVFRALGNGATIITASRRLARVLTREFHTLQTERGLRAWSRPDALPLDALLDRLWRDWLWRGANKDAPLLLNESQELRLWERVIRDSPAGESLLRIPETARAAAQTWQLAVAYRVPVDGSFQASDDAAAFAGWSREFRNRCRSNGWMERARLSDFLREKITAREVKPPGDLYIAGFDEMTPRQSEFLETIGPWRMIETQIHCSSIEYEKARDSTAEIRHAAAWARRLLESNPKAQIGVVAPDLASSRNAVERIFRRRLEGAVHLSIGPPLSDYPLVRGALLMLEFARGPLPLSQAGTLLRSPFLCGAEEERSRRALLDVKLRKQNLWDIEMPALRKAAGSCPILQRSLRRVEKKIQTVDEAQAPSEWAARIASLLGAFGWPGDRTLTSNEFQTIEAWRALLSNLASLDLTSPEMSFSQAIGWLRQNATDMRFQPEDEGAPVQIMGMLEAAGLHFDHLWIIGLHDEALPPAANPNPFIPYPLQRQQHLPHSTPARELDFARKLMDRLLRSAANIVLSYPEREGDRALAPSPLVGAVDWRDAIDATTREPWTEQMRASATFETLADGRGPTLAQEGSTGGAALFKDMAACPFRAFARHRLGAKPLEDPDFGLSYRDRGTTVHGALEFIWRELGSHTRLLELSPETLNVLIAEGARSAVDQLGAGIGRNVEIRRLQRLLAEWFEIEKSRLEFTVTGLEAERVVHIAGVQVKLRADRVDELPDGRQIILDYKTGQLKSLAWDGERPDEPQLPLYCITNERPVAGAAFAVLRSDDMKFRGLSATNEILPHLTKMKLEPPLPLEQQVPEWRRVLERLAENYVAGDAAVDPKPGACDHCEFHAFCRVRELQHDRG